MADDIGETAKAVIYPLREDSVGSGPARLSVTPIWRSMAASPNERTFPVLIGLTGSCPPCGPDASAQPR